MLVRRCLLRMSLDLNLVGAFLQYALVDVVTHFDLFELEDIFLVDRALRVF